LEYEGKLAKAYEILAVLQAELKEAGHKEAGHKKDAQAIGEAVERLAR
jgi:FtsZ-binding cell division protein ZapB